MIFLGTLFQKDQEQRIISNSSAGVSNAANLFQWRMIEGFVKISKESLSIINVIPVGCWPRCYRILKLPDATWKYENTNCLEIGCINLPIIKQITRAIKIYRYLRTHSEEKEIIVFTAYLPFLLAVYHLPRDRNVSIVITDIPEYYDMHKVSSFRKTLRKLHNKFVYHCLSRVDRFILLTDQMKEPLKVGKRPYLVMEGICDVVDKDCFENEVKDDFVVLYAGRLNRRYGLDLLLDAIDEIGDPNVKLWICGSGEMTNEIKERERNNSSIKFFGFLSHEDVLKIQQQVSMLINPRANNEEYTKYSFPSKTMEYMATGKPVVMYRLDGIPPEYDPYLFYIKEESAESICQTILKIKGMTISERTQAGEGARNFIKKNKNKDVQMKRVLDFIKLNESK